MSAAQDTSMCKQPVGVTAPVIDARRCEGKAECAKVCPYDVFEVRKLTSDERAVLTIGARLKVWAHGGRQAFVVRGDQCHACGLCVASCPENAIRLSR
jgi:NAD-dependent dihydropyrimidine dehydrogenase PreA subunit